MTDKTVSLVLGSGGARGLAHIGVLRCLEERGYELAYISGTSIGALIGGIYATGKLEVYAQWVSALTRSDVLRLLDWSFSDGAVFKGERLIAELKSMIGDIAIEDLPVKFTAVATDLNTEREVWFTEGPLWEAVRASIAVPLIFAPVELGEKLLVDGGLINPIPIAPTFNSGASRTFAVDLNGRRESRADSQASKARSEPADTAEDPSLQQRVVQFIDNLTQSLPSIDWTPPAVFDLAIRSMDTMQTSISRMKLAGYSPDVLISVPRNLATFFEFYRARELIDYGYRATEEALSRHNE